jgi:hypothetical protein
LKIGTGFTVSSKIAQKLLGMKKGTIEIKTGKKSNRY